MVSYEDQGENVIPGPERLKFYWNWYDNSPTTDRPFIVSSMSRSGYWALDLPGLYTFRSIIAQNVRKGYFNNYWNENWKQEDTIRLVFDIDGKDGFRVCDNQSFIMPYILKKLKTTGYPAHEWYKWISNPAKGNCRVYFNFCVKGWIQRALSKFLTEGLPKEYKGKFEFDDKLERLRTLFSYKPDHKQEKAGDTYNCETRKLEPVFRDVIIPKTDAGIYSADDIDHVKDRSTIADILEIYSPLVPQDEKCTFPSDRYLPGWKIAYELVAEKKQNKQVEREKMSTEDEEKFVGWVEEYFKDNEEFQIVPKSEGFIILKRIKPGNCPVSDEVHDGGKRAAWVNTRNGNVYFGCCCGNGPYKCIGSYREDENGDEEEIAEFDIKAWIKEVDKLKISQLYTLSQTEAFKVNVRDEPFVQSMLDIEDKCFGVSAGCGMRKTTQMLEVLKQCRDQTMLIVTPRISFANTMAGRVLKDTGIKFDVYNKITGDINSDKIICQMESIHRLKKFYDIIIIDEIESCLVQLVSKQTNKHHLEYNNQRFKELLKVSNKIIFMDAFLNQNSLSYLQQIGLSGRVDYYNFMGDVKTAIKFPYERVRDKKKDNGVGRFTRFLIGELEKGKKIYFPCMSRGIQTKIAEKIRENLPDKKLLLYNSDKKLDDRDINVEWIKYDLVSTTSTITVGVNFDVVDHFDFIAVYLSTMSKVICRDVFQCAYRVRKTRENRLYWILNNCRIGIEQTQVKEIYKQLEIKQIEHAESIAKVLGDETVENELKTLPSHVKYLYVRNLYEKGLNLMNTEECWLSCLEMGSYILDNIDDHEIRESDEIMIIESNVPIIIEYDDIPELTPSQKKELLKFKNNGTISALDNAKLLKYDYQNLMMREDEEYVREMWRPFLEYKHVFYNMSIEKGFDPNSPEQLARLDLSNCAEFSGMKLSKVQTIEMLIKRLGLENSRDFDSIIRRDVIESLASDITNQQDKLQAVFGFRSRAKGKTTSVRQTADLISSVLNKWTGSKLVATNKRNEKFQLKDEHKIGDKLFEHVNPSFQEKKHVRILKPRLSLVTKKA